ncbi:MAG: putative oxidoreductase YhhX [Nitrosomonadaceae bacterium]|nr:putative oxidoreductase YhhX [Nitrosomonadaceae bacterium]
MPKSEFRTVIVGLGSLTRAMVPLLEPLRWFKPVALVDVRQEALSQIGSHLGIGSDGQYTDLDKALADLKPELTIVNSPPRFHYEQTKKALLGGSNVLVAKPLATSFEDAVELVNLAEACGLKLTVGQQMRYRRHYRAVKRFVQSDRLGTIEFINFSNAKHRPNMGECTMSQPVLYEMSCHHFDSLLDALPGYIPDSVMCDGFQPSWSPYNGPCTLTAFMVFKHAVNPPLHMNYHAGHSSQTHKYEYRLEGSKGVIRCRGIHHSDDSMDYEFAERGKKLEPITADEGIPIVEPWDPFLEAWLDYMEGGTEPAFSGRNNLKAFALLCACEEAINTKLPVNLADHPLYSQGFPALLKRGGTS